jgi:hypothetical protein
MGSCPFEVVEPTIESGVTEWQYSGDAVVDLVDASADDGGLILAL